MDSQTQLTALGVVQRIQGALPAETHPGTVDVFLEGDPDLAVKGVAVTMMATLEVLEMAVAGGANMVITHEPLYFNHHNAFVPQLAGGDDPVYLAKRAFLLERRVTVWHCHDRLHQIRPDMIHLGVLTALGWPSDGIGLGLGPSVVDIPEASLGDVLRHVADKLGSTSLRYVGDPHQRVRRVAVACGYGGLEPFRPVLSSDEIDLAMVGEAWEWEFGEYAYDAAWIGRESGRPKAFAVLGHVPSEQQGMAFFARRLQEIVPEVDVSFVPAADIYRSL
ncbi:MAG: Nif3-like dinuclear metal center hexameric protein [Bifidobacteriaceae bacterium]|jgi:putative NIF3 family GTP cyclohydrolase 1 type 2|nr:Nif3-like dinuclear metal center hexameric protein [Bifidobacteriaceae bacterium]